MGIILKNSKLVFDELIGTSFFDDFFKNGIRDYYTYGFKSYDQFEKGKKTIAERWKIFSRILEAQWSLEKGKNGQNRIILKQMDSMVGTPIDELYFFHNIGLIGDYLNYLLELDKNVLLRDGMEALPIDVDEILSVEGENGKQPLELVNELEYAIISNWLSNLKKGHKEEILPVRMNRQLNLWSAATRYGSMSYRDRYKNLNNRTNVLQAYGILGNLKDNPQQRNKWLKKEWEMYDPFYKRYFYGETSGTDYWFKSPLTMEKLVEDVLGKNGLEGESEFLKQFSMMCYFFAQYYPLGEIGTILVNRCSYKAKCEDMFKIRHNYIQKSLYDYNLIDILNAIEHKKMCWIQYTHATNMNSFEEIIIPLEIRISVTNGREYVIYYQITERKIRALRIEFIDKIMIYSSIREIKAVKRNVQREKKRIHKSIQEEKVIEIDQKEIMEQVKQAEQMLPYIWGTEITECVVDNHWRKRLKIYEIEILYDLPYESYIVNRIKKEKRKTVIGDIEYEGKRVLKIQCFPTKELRIWLRSFYKRIGRAENIEIEEFNLLDDIEKMWNLYYGDEVLTEEMKTDTELSSETEIGYEIKGKVMSDLEGHAALFNELFSKHSVTLANAIMKASSLTKESVREIFEAEIKHSFAYYTEEEICKAAGYLLEYAQEKELIDKEEKTRFVVNKEDYLYQLLPITKVECRWLLMVLNSPMSKIFIEGKQIDALKMAMQSVPFYTTPFPIEKINYFDQYNKKECERRLNLENEMVSQLYHSQEELQFLKMIYQAMIDETEIEITYKTWKKIEKVTICAPAWLEYSRRDDIFRVWCVDGEKERIQKVNVNRILVIKNLADRKYSLKVEQERIQNIQDKSMQKLEVEFYDEAKNIPDRILTEFSVWRKRCVYDIKTRKYKMELYYSILDEKEILIRLMSYGPHVKITAPDDNFVYSEIKRRIEQQKKLLS